MESKIKIGIVEDEGVIAENIYTTLELLGYEALEPCDSFEEGVRMLDEEKPDLVLLDIQLKGSKTGIDLAWYIREEHDIPFIFLTSNSDAGTVELVKKVNPPAFLVKPFNRDDLFSSIEICLFNYARRGGRSANQSEGLLINDAIFIKQKDKLHKVTCDDILYFQSDHVYIDLFIVDGRKLTVRGSMDEFMGRLPNGSFFRTHRSYAINLKHLQTINGGIVRVSQLDVPLSKRYRDELLNAVRLG